jgi:hypothetical protein
MKYFKIVRKLGTLILSKTSCYGFYCLSAFCVYKLIKIWESLRSYPASFFVGILLIFGSVSWMHMLVPQDVLLKMYGSTNTEHVILLDAKLKLVN